MAAVAKPKTKQQAISLLDIQEIRREKAIRCKASFAYFLKQAWHVIEPAKSLIWGIHVEACAAHLQAIGDGEIHRLVANLPPGYGKSTLFSVAFPAWTWIRNPHERFLCASYAMDLSIRDRHNCRMLIESEWYQSLFGDVFQMLPDQNQKSFYENTCRGFMQASATFSSTTGKRCTIGIIDDANNAMAGQADVAATVEWFGKSWISRLNDREHGTMLVVGQRLYSEDLTAHILELGGWEHLCLPMEAELARTSYTSIGWSDPRTKEGELLCPELTNEKGVAELQHAQGSFHYAAQQQQAPVPKTGGTFKKEWARYFEVHGAFYILHTKYGREKPVAIKSCQRYAVCDPAVSEKQEADFWVLQIWDVTPENEALLLAQLRGHFDNPDQQKKIIEWYERHLWMGLWVETVAYQLALFQQLKNYEQTIEVQPGLYQKRTVSIPVKEWKPARGDKVARAGVAALKMEQGDLYWLLHASYLTDLTPEIFAFPKSKKDDQVDGHSMICDILSNPTVPLSGYVLEHDRVTLPTPSTQVTTSPEDLAVLQAKLNEYERERGLPLT